MLLLVNIIASILLLQNILEINLEKFHGTAKKIP